MNTAESIGQFQALKKVSEINALTGKCAEICHNRILINNNRYLIADIIDILVNGNEVCVVTYFDVYFE